ncbi:3'-5' exonuclease [Cupriavidus metallidurans]|uniref:3'-5' exonuclease n=1 Tax=Cupriavidus metallidurans TaxID=119219 RepID=UPI001CCDF61C|nr:3'-5' exonuclease [Cupriavidus metallidurans]UBM12687.1 3'-5' exonuclease [Cupriavidus metallidurans]
MRIVAGLDTETTGLAFADGHRFVEVGVISCDLDTGKLLSSYVQRIDPQRPIDPKAQAVHGISYAELAGQPLWEQVAPQFHAQLARAQLLVAHNGVGFDIPFITHEFARVGLPMPNVPVVDTMLEGRWATPFGKLPNLNELCFATGTPYDPNLAHGAAYDIAVMLSAFFKARRKGFFRAPAVDDVPVPVHYGVAA